MFKFNKLKSTLNINALIILSLFYFSVNYAAEIGVEFSATAVQKAPDRLNYESQMYIGKDYVRTDSVVRNTNIIEIQNTKTKTKYFLLPKDKVYMEVKLNNPNMPKVEINQNTKPCDGMVNTQCELLATESVFGRPTEKWEFIVKQPGQQSSQKNDQSLRSLHWIDVERRMIVREFLPNGTINELIPQGDEIINQRKSEKWLWQVSGPDGLIRSSTQWYDPELKITTREEIKGGFIRELTNIKIETQQSSLFKIPESYTQVNDLQKYMNANTEQPNIEQSKNDDSEN